MARINARFINFFTFYLCLLSMKFNLFTVILEIRYTYIINIYAISFDWHSKQLRHSGVEINLLLSFNDVSTVAMYRYSNALSRRRVTLRNCCRYVTTNVIKL